MKLRAQIVVDIEAANYAEAAEHQRYLEWVLENVKSRYEAAQLLIRKRRKEYRAHETAVAAHNVHMMKRRRR